MRILLFLSLAFNLTFDLSGQVKISKIDNYLEQARMDWGVPGLSVAIIKNGEVVLKKGYGVSRQGMQKPVDENTLYAIASNTKAFISTALAKLVDEGKVNWDDKVIDYVPYFELYDPYATSEATLKDLLCHRLGLGTYSGDVIWYKSELSVSQVIKRIKYVPQEYSFRGGYGYSNLMFITAGEVIHVVTGKSWDHYVKEHFFQPLGMSRTVTSTQDLTDLENVATPHKTKDNSNLPIKWTNWDNMGAAGGIISSVNDMSKWIQLNLNKGIWKNDTIFTSEQQNLLWTIQNNFVINESSDKWIPGRNFNGYGLGWGLYDYFGRKVVTHSGGYDGMYSRVVLVPSENLGFVILTNSMSGITNPLMLYLINAFIEEDKQDWSEKYLDRPGSGGIPEMVIDRKEARKKNTNPSFNLEAYEGTYHDPMYGNINVNLENGGLRLYFENAPLLSADLEHWHYDTWEIKWDEIHAWFDFGTVQFIHDNNLKVKELSFDVPNYDIFFHELHPKRKN